MNNSKKLKLILQILICILIILIGIVGIYTRNGNMYINLLPGYTLGSDINGVTFLEFEVDDTKETVYYDKEGNEVDSSKITEKNEKNYTKKEIPVNSEENLNLKNYNKTIEIMEKRLKFLKADQYQIDLNEKTGKILLSVEDEYMDDIVTFLPMESKLQFIDSNTEDVVIDYTDFKAAESSYAQLTKEIVTYMNLSLNDSGIEKFNNIDKYKKIENIQNEDGKTEEKESKLLIMFDSQKIAEVSYDEMLLNGKVLRLTTASGLTSDEEINSQLNLEATVCRLATIGKMPVIYDLAAEEFVKNSTANYMNYIIISMISVIVIISIILIFKYKLRGVLTVLGIVNNISIFLILIRLTKVPLSLNSLAGMFGLILLNTILVNNILKCIKEKEKTFFENIKNAYLKTLDIFVIMLIIFSIFAFSSMTVINSMGLLLFWGWLTILLGNLIFTVPMLYVISKK